MSSAVCRPVSYTHLDVYKRQPDTNPGRRYTAKSVRRPWTPCGCANCSGIRAQRDVYKRQLYPHAGTWKEARTVEESYQLNLPAYAVQGGRPGQTFSYAAVEPRNVVLETVKQAEDGDGVVLRMYECENARTKTVVRLPEGARKAYLTNLLEEVQEELPIVDGKVTFITKPFEIQTLLVK